MAKTIDGVLEVAKQGEVTTNQFLRALVTTKTTDIYPEPISAYQTAYETAYDTAYRTAYETCGRSTSLGIPETEEGKAGAERERREKAEREENIR